MLGIREPMYMRGQDNVNLPWNKSKPQEANQHLHIRSLVLGANIVAQQAKLQPVIAATHMSAGSSFASGPAAFQHTWESRGKQLHCLSPCNSRGMRGWSLRLLASD